ncbi:hypothetical protein EG327_010506 [Venturia inaequalis]|uniref:Nicotinamide N-methyltransferase n=1 Tax=Venturia inaequalis TaxID=5025 RepID=A0A8H3YRW7_VENIN|nr:hypothetical protein EG327_010506 [Venturia inaequalis]
MLSSLLRALPKSKEAVPEPEDIFQYSLGLIFTDDLQIQHGDPGTTVNYRSNGYGDLEFEVADPQGEEERTKFAHYLWNAGVLMSELVGGRGEERVGKKALHQEGEEEEWGKRSFEKGEWWLDEAEEEKWSVKGERVLELGAGVGLAGIISALAGAEEAHYPSPSIIQTLTENVAKNITTDLRPRVSVEPHKWGELDTPFALSHQGCYTRILAADTLWMSMQHTNLAKSMLHFLSPHADARIFVIAGFHTGRARMAPFFEETVEEEGLEIEDIYEMDANGKRREWRSDAPEEMSGERKKWLVVARLKRKS